MNSVGIDLHRKRSHVAVIDEDGTELLSRRIVNDPADVPRAAGRARGRVQDRARGDLRLGVARRPARGGRLRAAPRAPAADQGDRLGAREDRRRRRAHARPPAARRPAARGLHRAARAARPARSAAPPGRAHPDALGAQEPRAGRSWPSRASSAPTATCSAPRRPRFLAELELREGPRRRLDSLLALIADFDREIDATSARDRRPRQGGPLRRGALPDPRRRALHRDARDRRGRRRHPLPRPRASSAPGPG